MIARIKIFVRNFGVLCIACMFVLLLAQVVLRYVFGLSYFATEEIARYLLIWATLAGCAYEVSNHGHIQVRFLLERFSARTQRRLIALCKFILLLLFLLLTYTGVSSTIFNHGQESAGMQIPLSFPFLAVPVFFFCCAIFVLADLTQNLNSKNSQ